MPVTRCSVCHRGNAGYLDSEKTIDDLTLPEVQSEKAKYEAKLQRLRDYVAGIRDGTVTPQAFPPGVPCPGCGQGHREFQQHRKDLEQLTLEEAEASYMATSRDYRKLLDKETALSSATAVATTTP
jgi:DNA repair exonuclease SbcCD ATPase subunit